MTFFFIKSRFEAEGRIMRPAFHYAGLKWANLKDKYLCSTI